MKTRNIALTLGLFAAFTASANTGGTASSGAGMGTSGNNTTSVPAPQAGTTNNNGITNNDGSISGNQGGTANDPTMGSASGNTTGRTSAFGTNAENNAAVTNNSASFNSRQSIMDAQRSLVNQGFSVSVDGRNGAQTQAAVRRFQARNGLPETGVIDSRTQEALSSSGTSTTQPSASDTSAE